MMKKRILSILLAVVLLSTLAWAVDADGPGAEIDPETGYIIRYYPTNDSNQSELAEETTTDLDHYSLIGYPANAPAVPEGKEFKGWAYCDSNDLVTTLTPDRTIDDGVFCLYPVFGSPTSTIVIIVPAEEQIQNPTTGALLTVAALPAAAAAHFGALAH